MFNPFPEGVYEADLVSSFHPLCIAQEKVKLFQVHLWSNWVQTGGGAQLEDQPLDEIEIKFRRI